MSIFKAARHGMFGYRILQRLNRYLAIRYEPYYVIREGDHRSAVDWPCLPQGYSATVLDTNSAHCVVGLAPWLTEASVNRRISEGHVCVAITHAQLGTVACTWADLEQVNDRHCPYRLASGEAYLYDAYVHDKARGAGLASSMRAASYRYLAERGCTGFISISDKYNTPALKFKGRLGAEITACFEFLSVGGVTLLHFQRATSRSLPT